MIVADRDNAGGNRLREWSRGDTGRDRGEFGDQTKRTVAVTGPGLDARYPRDGR